MGHKCFISFKKEDEAYKKAIQSWVDINKVDMIDKSLNTPIDSDNEDYIMRKIREDYLSDSTVTIFLIGTPAAISDIHEAHVDAIDVEPFDSKVSETVLIA